MMTCIRDLWHVKAQHSFELLQQSLETQIAGGNKEKLSKQQQR